MTPAAKLTQEGRRVGAGGLPAGGAILCAGAKCRSAWESGLHGILPDGQTARHSRRDFSKKRPSKSAESRLAAEPWMASDAWWALGLQIDVA